MKYLFDPSNRIVEEHYYDLVPKDLLIIWRDDAYNNFDSGRKFGITDYSDYTKEWKERTFEAFVETGDECQAKKAIAYITTCKKIDSDA